MCLFERFCAEHISALITYLVRSFVMCLLVPCNICLAMMS